MALFGAQLVLSMIVASFLQKLSPHYSLARWLLCSRLVRYKHPTDEELKSLAGIPSSSKGKNKKERRTNGTVNGPFTVPRNLDIPLDTCKIYPLDVLGLQFYPEFQWMVDFAVCALFVYIMTEIYYTFFATGVEFNLSILWCVMVLGFVLKALCSVTAAYFRGDEHGERSLCITFGFFFFVTSMVVLIVDEGILEFGLEAAYDEFSKNSAIFLQSQGLESRGPATKITLKLILAIWCGIIGAFLTFPGLRVAKTHTDSIKYCKENIAMQTILHLSFISPMFIMLLWIKPISRDNFIMYSQQSILTPNEAFDTIKLFVIIFVIAIRFSLIFRHLQSYLNMAHDKMQALKKEAGRISSLELQRMVSRVYCYLCVVAVQYMAPLLFILFLTFLLKTLGSLSWCSSFIEISSVNLSAKASPHPIVPPNLTQMESISEATEQFSLAIASLKSIFTPIIFRGILSFAVWWVCSVWFIASVFGIVYYSHFAL